MRLFTAFAACALLLGACSQQDIAPVANGDATTRGGKGQMVGFHKVVQIGEDEYRPAAPGEFTFDLYQVHTQNGKTELIGSYPTDDYGDVWVDFTEFRGQGWTYYFTEVFATEEDAAKWEPLDDLAFSMVSNKGSADWGDYGDFLFNEGPVVVNVPVPAEEDPVIEEPELSELFGSVTLSNVAGDDATVWPGTNHFCFAALTREELVEGVTLQMVQGNPRNDVGDARVQLVGDKIVITVDGVGEICAFAQTETPAEVQGNPHSGLGHDDFDKTFEIECPDGDVIYLYAHINLQFYI
jgi:hypothetical protein